MPRIHDDDDDDNNDDDDDKDDDDDDHDDDDDDDFIITMTMRVVYWQFILCTSRPGPCNIIKRSLTLILSLTLSSTLSKS